MHTPRRIYTYQPMLHYCTNSVARGIIGGVIIAALLVVIAVCAIGWARAAKRTAAAEATLAAYREQVGMSPPDET